MPLAIPGFWSYVEEGADWAGRFFSNPSKAAADYLDPSKIKERTKDQASALLNGGSPSPLPKPADLPDLLPEGVKKYGKYAKYALIGGGVLIAYRLLKK